MGFFLEMQAFQAVHDHNDRSGKSIRVMNPEPGGRDFPITYTHTEEFGQNIVKVCNARNCLAFNFTHSVRPHDSSRRPEAHAATTLSRSIPHETMVQLRRCNDQLYKWLLSYNFTSFLPFNSLLCPFAVIRQDFFRKIMFFCYH